MPDRVFSIKGNKRTSTMVMDGNSLKFSSRNFRTASEFLQEWNARQYFVNKVEIQFNQIQSVTKEDGEKDIVINYGSGSKYVFSFSDPFDNEPFTRFLERELRFHKTIETLTPLRASRNHLLALVITVLFTAIAYFKAIQIANGSSERGRSGRTLIFDYLVGFLGDKGVLAMGGLIAAFVIYQIWLRFSKPHGQMKFLPPNS